MKNEDLLLSEKRISNGHFYTSMIYTYAVNTAKSSNTTSSYFLNILLKLTTIVHGPTEPLLKRGRMQIKGRLDVEDWKYSKEIRSHTRFRSRSESKVQKNKPRKPGRNLLTIP